MYLMFWGGGWLVGAVLGLFVLRRRGQVSAKTAGALLVAGAGVLIGAKWQFRLEYLPWRDALRIPLADLVNGGNRLPLGLLVGGLLAGFYCCLLRAPWWETGDALAANFSLMIVIGRFGCLANGCCMGSVCPAWAFFCVRYPPGAEAYNRQLIAHLIPPGAVVSLPAHPLPLYFSAAAAMTLALLLWLLWRGARPGTLLVTFCILRPLTKLALEPLRASSPDGPSGLMLGVPLVGLTLTSSAVALTYLRARLRAPVSLRP